MGVHYNQSVNEYGYEVWLFVGGRKKAQGERECEEMEVYVRWKVKEGEGGSDRESNE